MKKLCLTILVSLIVNTGLAQTVLNEGFEYGNHDGETPVGWICEDASWLCGYQVKDHNRTPHEGSWYAYTNADESWMFLPMYISQPLKYRFSYWAISDGSYTLEFWAGNRATIDDMTELLCAVNVDSGAYENFDAYIDAIGASYDFIGIRAIASEGAYHLSIDDIQIKQIVQYSFEALPAENDTTMTAGAEFTFHFKFRNDGYESPLKVYITPHTEYFTDINFYINGELTTVFYINQDETIAIRGTAKLRSDIEPGTLCWFDVLFSIDCGCATAMYTYWATVVTEGSEENIVSTSIYPNPSTGNVTIEGNGTITVFNALGQKILTKDIIEKDIITLDKGIYFVKKNDGSTEKLIIE